MTQPRIFVTYTPAPRLAQRSAARSVRQSGPPAMAVIASAILAGGALHGFGGTETKATPPVSGAQAPDGSPRLGQPGSRPLPLRALASVSFEAPTKLAPKPKATSAAPHLSAPLAPPPPVKAQPRRDLAGFLAERGLSLAEAAPPVAAAAGPSAAAAPIAALEEVAEPTPIASVAVTTSVAAAAPAAATAPQSAAPEIETQSYPTIAVGGEDLGAVTMRGDKIHLGSLVGLLKLKLPADEFAKLSAAPAADSFVDAETLRAAGIGIAQDPGGERVTLTVL